MIERETPLGLVRHWSNMAPSCYQEIDQLVAFWRQNPNLPQSDLCQISITIAGSLLTTKYNVSQ